MQNINFQQLGKDTRELPRSSSMDVPRESLNSSSMSVLPGFRSSFKDDTDKVEYIRNFSPICLNKNVTQFALVIDKSKEFWTKKRMEHQTQNLPVSQVIIVRRQIFTVTEHKAIAIISRCYKIFSFRKRIMFRIEKKRILKRLRKRMNLVPKPDGGINVVPGNTELLRRISETLKQ